jgi:hypothetical protein
MKRRVTGVLRFVRLPGEQQRVLPLVALLLGLARLLVRYTSVPKARQVIGRLAPRCGLSARRVAELVAVAAQALPGATACLSRAIVLEAVLVAAGRPAGMRIGVAPRRGGRQLDAHAWVELSGAPVAEDVSRYTALPLFGVRG